MTPRSLEELLHGRDGLRIAGDVQAHADALADVLAGARAANLAILLLGDIVDRGPDAPGALRLVLDMLRRDGELVPGNHDDKLRRWAAGRRVELERSGLAGTLEQVAAAADGADLVREFAAAVAIRPLWRRAGRWFFVHGGFHPAMLRHDPGPPLAEKEKVGWLAARALYGETDGTRLPDGFPNRTYRWLDLVPAKISVAIGHDVVSTSEIVRRRGARGGEAVFLDTGIDRGGRLSYLDIPGTELSPGFSSPASS
jgi:protein phosphatase